MIGLLAKINCYVFSFAVYDGNSVVEAVAELFGETVIGTTT